MNGTAILYTAIAASANIVVIVMIGRLMAKSEMNMSYLATGCRTCALA